MNNKTKIGARQLSENEIKSILPTYENILTQIDDIRNGKEYKYSDDVDNIIQKTNNIGIIGCRGAGKTSILKTLKNKIEKENPNDIILPIIVPENMSETSTLMATILALLKKHIDRLTEEDNRYCISKCGLHTDELTTKYEETIKQYAFIQNDYRSILINQFTTENQYVKKINEVFNSDKEFINKFRTLIRALINKSKEKNQGKGKEPLIIIFIDDIDLSTKKCTDVIKTLLSYISDENILTFVSGDLDTFEEALTLEFIRQEEAMHSNILNESFLAKGSSLLERKKILAYEYLKKVLPPIYRHNIKYWSLENKGNFKVDLTDENDSNKQAKALNELLTSVFEEYIPKAFFKYYKEEKDEKNKENEENKENVKKVELNLPFAYRLFDNTSRGLNNVYSLLVQINNLQTENNKDITFPMKKLFLETVVSSKPLYNTYRNEIFENIILFGDENNSTIVRWENFDAFIEKRKDIEKKENTGNDNANLEGEYIINNVDKFDLFILTYFASKLFEIDLKKSDVYLNVKNKMIAILINTPQISENLSNAEKEIKIENNTIKIEKNEKTTGTKNTETLIDNITEPPISDDFFSILISFLFKLDLEYALVLYKIISEINFDIFYFRETKDTVRKKELVYLNIKNIYLALSACSDNLSLSINEIYSDFSLEFAYIQNNLFSDERTYIINSILNEIVIDKNNISEILFRNLISNTIKKNDIWDKNNKLKEPNTKDLSGKDKERNIIIHSINNKKLWNDDLSKNTKNYIINNITKLIKEIFINADTNNTKIDISTFKDNTFEKFKKIYKGETWTIANDLMSKLEIIINDKKEHNINNTIIYKDYKEIYNEINKLNCNNKVKYGQYEAQLMLNELRTKSYIDENDTDSANNTEKSKEELERYIYYLSLFKLNENANYDAKLFKDFLDALSKSLEHTNENMISSFIDSINDITDEYTLSMERYNELFK